MRLYIIDAIDGDAVICGDSRNMASVFPRDRFPDDIRVGMPVIRKHDDWFIVYEGAFEDEGQWWQVIYHDCGYTIEKRRPPLSDAEIRSLIEGIARPDGALLYPTLIMTIGDLLADGRTELALLLIGHAETMARGNPGLKPRPPQGQSK